MDEQLPFASRVAEGMGRRGLTLRGLCREADLDPSFFSKVLSGKRSPPSEEPVLRRLAAILGLEPAELIVAAGRIPSEWRALWTDERLFNEVSQRLTGRISQRQATISRHAEPEARRVMERRPDISTELL